jgi:hypothetical protein
VALRRATFAGDSNLALNGANLSRRLTVSSANLVTRWTAEMKSIAVLKLPPGFVAVFPLNDQWSKSRIALRSLSISDVARFFFVFVLIPITYPSFGGR